MKKGLSFCLDRKKCGWLARVLLPLVLLLLTGCVEQSDAAQPRYVQPAGEITSTHTVGQTFVATADNLTRLDVLMATYARRNRGPVVFYLRQSPTSAENLVRIEIEAATIRDNEYRTFRFDPIPDSGGRSFYFFFESPEAAPGNAVTVWQSAQDVYPDGATVIDGLPGEGDLAFQSYTGYSLHAIAADLWWGIWHRGWVLVLSGLLFTLPGYALAVVLLRLREPSLSERLILSSGLSVALLSLIMYIAGPLSLRLGAWAAWSLVVLSALVVLWHHRSALRVWRIQTVRHWQPDLAGVGLMIAFGLTLAVRLLAVRDLAAPMWGDSYQHTMVVQLMADHGGLFQSWEPYAPLASFTYHFGFQAVTAFFHWLTGVEVLHSVLWVGQILNALAALALYPLAVKVARGNRWAGVLAVIVAGLLSKMPMYYVNWGRYTQLAGQVILPLAMWLTWEAVDRKAQSGRLLVITIVSVSGLALTHYRVLLMYLAFVLPLGIVQLWSRRQSPGETLLRLGVIGGTSLVVVLPWVGHSLAGHLPRWLGYHVSQAGASAAFTQQYNAIGPISYFAGYGLLAWGGLGGAWGLLKKQRGILLILLWMGTVFLMANPGLVGLSGTGIINNHAVFIAIYIPIALLGGWLGGQLIEIDKRHWGRRWKLIALTGLMGLSLWGGADRLEAVEPSKHALLTRQDMAALDWIQSNTPPDARFLINSFFAYGGTAVVGSDGGWWLPLLAGRANTVPPLTYSLEQGNDPQYPYKVNAFARQIQGADMDASEVRRLLREQGVTHIYIGEKQGHVNYGGDDVLDATTLLNSQHYRMIYHQGKTWVFELVDDE